ncbi:HNH endonuclease [Streptomyces sp. YGL11-2]|uniref:HNH endonuclease n=1 Tax=Streptomyces sp. YGL11-2 TaxID=3414028 RepID=UPI003CF64C6D
MRARTRFTLWVHLTVLCANDGLCVYCNEAKSEVMDHVIPFARGGPDKLGNLVPACEACNASKNDKTPPEWIVARRLRHHWTSTEHKARDEARKLWDLHREAHRECEEVEERIEAVLDEIEDRTRRKWILMKTMFRGAPSSRSEISSFRSQFEMKLKAAQEAGFPQPWSDGESVLSVLARQEARKPSREETS